MKSARSRASGFTIIEMLATLSLLATFAIIASHLFTSVFKLMNHNTQSIEVPIRFDAALAALRTDMAAATATESANPQSLILHTSTDTIQWRSDEHLLIRQSATTQRSWDVTEPIRFQSEGKLILVHSPNSAADIAIAPQLSREP